jgi:AraC-like DNA-binding protein
VFKSGKVVNLENHKTVFEQINEAVELEKLFLKKDFNFNKLMFLIGQSGDSIRAAIKINTNKTFIDFINTYRVAASVNLMENGYLDMHSLDSLGMASGFNSQQSFYRAFRKEYDLTPGEYWISKKTKK